MTPAQVTDILLTNSYDTGEGIVIKFEDLLKVVKLLSEIVVKVSDDNW